MFNNAVSVFALRRVREVDSELDNMAFHDLTPASTQLPPSIGRLLGLNMNFCMTPRPPRPPDLTAAKQSFIRNIRLHEMEFPEMALEKFAPPTRNGSSISSCDVDTARDKNSKLKSIYVKNLWFQPPKANPFIEAKMQHSFKQLATNNWTQRKTNNLNKSQQQLLKQLIHRHDLKVLMTDKNLGPAIMNYQQYIDFCLDHLQDTKTYTIIHQSKQHVEELLRTVVHGFIRSATNQFGELKELKIVINGLATKSLNRFYALAKIHKTPLQLRPIVSNSNSILQGLSTWLNFRLQPYLLNTTSYLRDSDQLREDLLHVKLTGTQVMITFDVVQLYTSIDIKRGLDVIAHIIEDDPLCSIILEGLRRVLFLNYFEFGDTIWKQIHGCAMGTSVAPTFASLFLAGIEANVILPKYQKHIKYYKRFIDDGFMIWEQDNEQPYLLQDLFATFTRSTKLHFTVNKCIDSASFLDLIIYQECNTLYFKTHQKALNLHLYLPAHSAHPPGVLKGMVFGLVSKYRQQNSKDADFKNIVQQLFTRLVRRGYRSEMLQDLFQLALERLHRPRVDTSMKKCFFKIRYDPNGPSRSQLRYRLGFHELLPLLKDAENTKLIICYTRPPNLKSKLCKTSLPLDRFPTPADRHIVRVLQNMHRTDVGGKTQLPKP